MIAPPAIAPAARLLLACTLGPRHIDPAAIAGLAAAIDDWEGFVASAAEALAFPFVHAALPHMGHAIPAASRGKIEQGHRLSAARGLQLAALLTSLDARWFAPNGIRYAAVKGATLAQRHYGAIAARTSRDLDLLVDPPSCPATIRFLIDAGFTPCRGFELPENRAKWDRYIAAMCDLNREISLRSPAGDLLDVHTALDLTGGDFPTRRLLGRRESVAVFGRSIPCLTTADLFVYLCYHHSRHNWTRLHWLADIGQVAAAPDFDHAQVMAAARRAGMERLVEACLAMPALLAAATHGEAPAGDGLAATMARQCLFHLEPGSEAPLLTYHRHIDDAGYRWRHWFGLTAEEWRHRRGPIRKLRSLLRSSTPSWEVYRAFPLPRGLRWLYLPLRTGSHIVRHSPLRRLMPRRTPRSATQESSVARIASDISG